MHRHGYHDGANEGLALAGVIALGAEVNLVSLAGVQPLAAQAVAWVCGWLRTRVRVDA